MELTWGYVWGIWWWRITGKRLKVERLRTNVAVIPATITSAHDLRASEAQLLRDRGLANGIPQNVPTDVVISGDKDPRIRSRMFTTHLWNGFVPMGSICMARKGYYVSSPEFCMLQVACILKRHITERLRPWQYTVILAELICELCGTYSKQNTSRGFKERDNPLTSIGQLMVFCGRVAFEQGASILRKALCWSIDNLNSLETGNRDV